MKASNLIVAAALVAVFGSARFTSAAVLLTDDFEAYADTAALNAVWNETPTGVGSLDTGFGFPGQSLSHPGGSSQKRLFTPTIATDAAPIVWEFDMYDDGNPDKRMTGGLRDNGGGAPQTALLEMGRYNSVYHPETGISVDSYAVRTAFLGGPDLGGLNGWLSFFNPNLNNFQPRVAGAHHFRAVVGDTSIEWSLDIFSDGFYDAFRTTPLTNGTGRAYNVARLGGPSDLTSSGGGTNFDNILVRQAETVTQPWSVTVVGGPHHGATGSGSFTYSDAVIDARGTGVASPTNGNLNLSLSLFGQTFDETNDIGYDFTPRVYFDNHAPYYMEYQVSEDGFNPTSINEPDVRAIYASNFLTPAGGGGFHQEIFVDTYPSPPVVLDNGSLRVQISGINGAIDQARFGGSDYYNPGTAVSNWGMQVGDDSSTFATNITAQNGGFTGIPVSVAAVGDTAVVTGTYAPGNGVQIDFTRTYSLVPGQNVLRITTEFVNSGADTAVAYFDTFDPDQGFEQGDGLGTYNDVTTALGRDAIVGQATAVSGLSVVMGSLDELATVASGYPFQISDGFALNGFFDFPFDGNGTFDDSGTHIGVRRFLAAGGSFSFTYDQAYGLTLGDARAEFIAANVPEPSTLLLTVGCLLVACTRVRRAKTV